MIAIHTIWKEYTHKYFQMLVIYQSVLQVCSNNMADKETAGSLKSTGQLGSVMEESTRVKYF